MVKLQVLSFLGTGHYEKTQYAYGGTNSPETEYIQEALTYIFGPHARYIIFATPEAMNKHGDTLRKRFETRQITPEFIPIASGGGTDLSGLFDKVYEAIGDDTEAVFDITHSYRSVPLIAFFSLIFAGMFKRVCARIVYGAFEVRDAGNITPLIDLSGLLDILDWKEAVDSYKKFGQIQLPQAAARLMPGENTRDADVQEIARIVKECNGFSESIIGVRGQEIRKFDGAGLAERLGRLAVPGAVATPVRLLLNEVKKMLEGFRPESMNNGYAAGRLCFDRGYLPQAAIILIETVISDAAQSIGMPYASPDERECISQALIFRGYCDGGKKDKFVFRKKNQETIIRKAAVAVAAKFVQHYNDLDNIRNDLAHAGERSSAAELRTLTNRLGKVLQEIERNGK